jgi:hypothetical protein
MSVGSKKKDKDKDAKGASGGEASTNYIVGSSQEPGSTTTANNKLSTREDISINQKEKITSSSPSRDEIQTEPMATNAASLSSSSTSKEVPYQYQQQRWHEQQSGINRVLDETRDNIRKSIDEARGQIPRYTQTANDYQEQTIESAREIADNFLESQKEIINSIQSASLTQIDAANRAFASTWMSPRYFTHIYTNIVSNFADNIIAASRLANNMIFANMEAFRTTIQQTRDNTKELSRINVNTARSLEETARDIAGGYASSSSSSSTTTSSEFYSGRGGYSFNHKVGEQQQIPSRQNEEDTQNVLDAQNHIAGQRRQRTVTDLPRAAAVGQALKDLRFPADKKRILVFIQQQSDNNPDYQKIVSLLDKIEDRQYQNASDVTKAAGIVE